MSTVTVSTIKLRLNKSSGITVDDSEIQEMIDAAEAEYAEYVLGLPGQTPIASTSVTQKFNGGGTSLVLAAPHVTAITAAAYSDGSTLTYTDLDLNTSTGIVGWNYNTAGYFTSGTRNVSLTYTLGALPANHKEAIAADVAGYFETTQRGGGSLRPAFPGEGEYEAAYAATPQVLFPRIRALAVPSIA
jgi:hypothetical protein